MVGDISPKAPAKAAEQSDRKRLIICIGSAIALLGLCVITCPPVLSAIRNKLNKKAMADYAAAAAPIEENKVEAYNRSKSAADYERCDTLIGYLSAPSISLALPVYRGTSEETLENAIGHLFGTDLPSETESTNCVLCGHNGLVGKDLFLHLPDLQVGDPVSFVVGDTEYRYTVTSTEVVEAGINAYAIAPGQTMLTLSTCTPVGVNSHRLLVHCMLDEAAPVSGEGSES